MIPGAIGKMKVSHERHSNIALNSCALHPSAQNLKLILTVDALPFHVLVWKVRCCGAGCLENRLELCYCGNFLRDKWHKGVGIRLISSDHNNNSDFAEYLIEFF